MKALTVIVLLLFHIMPGFAQPLWLRYPAISPDGDRIVFTYQGDIYTVSTDGGLATPMTIHEAHDFMPVWSHDGQQLAFASDRYGNFDVFVMPATGGQARRLTYHSNDDYPSTFSSKDQSVLFSSLRLDLHTNAQFPYGRLSELYQVNIETGKIGQVLTHTAEDAYVPSGGNTIYYHDRKGYEDAWRKHHTSSIARDLWTYNPNDKTYKKLTSWEGEDRNPVLDPSDNSLYWLSERDGDFNVYRMTNDDESTARQITKFARHPVRFLTISNMGTLCFSFDGEIYTAKKGEDPRKLEVTISNDTRGNQILAKSIDKGITEMSLSPNGKEFAYIFRGEVFVTSVDEGVTKRITNTPSQERSVSFSPDGRSVVYAGERDNNWNVYMSSIQREEEPYFYASTVVNEKSIVATEKEEFQPAISPDGKEVAYLEERVTLKVINLESRVARTVFAGEANYSYSDGDQHYQWSPDSKWFLLNFNQNNQWISEAGLIKASGTEQIINLTKSGYSDDFPKWMMDGEMMIWFSDRDGLKNHGSWGASGDIYGMFFNQLAFDRFQLSKEDYALLKEKEEKEKKEKEDKAKDEEPEMLQISLVGLDDRKVRLTQHSSLLSGAIMSPDGEKLYYLSEYEDGYDLWLTKPREKETKLLTKIGEQANSLAIDEDGKNIFVQGGGTVYKIDAETGKKEVLKTSGEMRFDPAGERAYIFDHAWRQVSKKFYREDLHGVDWEFYHDAYMRFLPHISNNHEFSEMLSEMLGELNASHTGCRYRHLDPNGDQTASLGLFYDENFSGKGIRIAEIINGGPFDNASTMVTTGVIIEKINDQEIGTNDNVFRFLNRIEGKNTLIGFYAPKTGDRWSEVVKPISLIAESELLYERWVDRMRSMVDKTSGGRLGYVHVRGMNNGSYRTVVEEVLGINYQKEALIVDTRFNGGGWLHEDLATFLSGERYLRFAPREKRIGFEPQFKWTKPTVLLVGEGNYSDAHMFPFAYRSKKLGQIIGMPVPGTGTAVWWERQIDPTLVFGIPQVGMLTLDGEYLENSQLEPDIKLANEPDRLAVGDDQQLAKAVEILLQEADQYKVEIEGN